MDDLISRQSAIEAVSRGCEEFRGIFARCEKNLNELPSAQPERITCQIGHALTADEIESLKKKLLDDAPIVLLPSTLPEVIMPLEPERKKGQWILDEDPHDGDCRCSACHIAIDQMHERNHGLLNALTGGKWWTFYKYCPYCGADMRGDKE